MTYTKVTKRFITIALAIFIALGAGYWFFTKTNRGSSWALYSIAGWHAPLSVKISCAKETDINVAKKFALPLKFDEKTKDELRGFWYYSYYRNCLFKNGYDFSGNLVPRSSIYSADSASATYLNPFIGISFSVPASTTIATDNALDVNFDDRLYASQLVLPQGNLTIHAYKEADVPELLTQLKDGLVITLSDGTTVVHFMGTEDLLSAVSSQITP